MVREMCLAVLAAVDLVAVQVDVIGEAHIVLLPRSLAEPHFGCSVVSRSIGVQSSLLPSSLEFQTVAAQ